MSDTSQIEIFDDKAASEEVIMQEPARLRVVDEALKEQRLRERASCGMLRRDSPGAKNEEEEAEIDSIFDILRSGKTIEADDYSALWEHPEDEESIKKKQGKENAVILAEFSKMFGPRIREALVSAMKGEDISGSDEKQWIATFTTLADWDFMVECENEKCHERFRSDKLWMKGKVRLSSSPKESLEEDYKTKTCPNCNAKQKHFHRNGPNNESYGIDPSDPNYGEGCFEEISQQICEILLILTCTTRYESENTYMALMGEAEFPIYVQNPESGKIRKLNSKISPNKKSTSHQAIEAANIVRLVLEANDSRPEGDEPILLRDKDGNRIHITRSSGSGRGVFYARGMIVRDEIARMLRRFRENQSGGDEAHPKTGETVLEAWSIDMATHIIFALERIGLTEWGQPTQEDNEEGWMLRLSQKATDFIDDNFEADDLSKFYSNETVPPMICPPEDWKLDDEHIATGGFVYHRMQKKMPIVTRELIHKRLELERIGSKGSLRRIEVTEQSLEALNKVQRTEFSVNKEMLSLVREAMFEHVKRLVSDDEEDGIAPSQVVLRKDESNTESDAPRFILELLSDKISYPSPGSFSEWIKELDYANSLLEDQVSNGRFYHPLNLDHRGRVYTASTLLDPQGDDVSRGIIQFNQPVSLTEDGWKWLSIATAKAWEGINVPGAPAKRSTFSELLAASQSEEFRSSMKSVSDDPIGTMEDWTDAYSDIMRAHAEGFQRLSVTMAFADALGHTDGPIGSPVRYVVRHDASSNIYQHISMLLLDKDMAVKVNVLESGSRKKGPNDVYTLVGDKVGEDGEFLQNLLSLGFDNNEAEKIRKSFSERKVAKSPVMVTGYGAGIPTIVEKWLSHNGKPIKERGKLAWFRTMEDEDYFKTIENTLEEAYDSIDGLKSDIGKNISPWPTEYNLHWKSQVTSLLRTALNLSNGIGPRLTVQDRKDIVENHPEGTKPNQAALDDSMYREIQRIQAIPDGPDKDEAIVNFKTTIEELKVILEKSGLPILQTNKKNIIELLSLDRHEGIENLFSALTKSPFQKCGHRNSVIAGILGAGNETQHIPVAYAAVKAYVAALIQVLPNYPEFKDTLKELLKFNSLYTIEWQPGTDHLGVIHRKIVQPDSQSIKRRKAQQYEQQDGKYPLSLTKKVYRAVRDGKAEASAIAPNFVHSIDAAHMRQVAASLCDHQTDQGQPPQFWMVHDAFGTHPNHIGKMREIVREELNKIYFEWEINHHDLATEAIKAKFLVLLLSKSYQGLANVFEQAAAEFNTNGDGQFLDNKPFRDRIERVAELMGINLEYHDALTEDEKNSLPETRLKDMCKERRLRGYTTMNKDKLIASLSFPEATTSIIPHSPLASIYDDTDLPEEEMSRLLSLVWDIRNSIVALSNLGSMLEGKDLIVAKNLLDYMHILRFGKRFFGEKPINGIGTLDLEDVTSVDDMDNWYFLS